MKKKTQLNTKFCNCHMYPEWTTYKSSGKISVGSQQPSIELCARGFESNRKRGKKTSCMVYHLET